MEIHFHDLTVYYVILKDFISGLSSGRRGVEPSSVRCLEHEERGIHSVVGGSVEVF